MRVVHPSPLIPTPPDHPVARDPIAERIRDWLVAQLMPISIDGVDVSSITIDGTDVTKVTADGDVVWSAGPRNSEADDKLIHRWHLGETDPFVDQIGDADGTNNGTTEVTGDWVDGAARKGDGTDDYIDTTTWGSFGSELDSDWAVALSVSPDSGMDTNRGLIAVDNANSDTRFYIMANPDESGLYLRDDDRDYFDASATGLPTDTPTRVVANKIGDDAEVWHDGSEKSMSVDDDGVHDFSDFDQSVPFLARRGGDGSLGNFKDATIDDICVFDDSLTQSEIESYNNPWE